MITVVPYNYKKRSYIGRWVTLFDLTGRRASPMELVESIRPFGWASTFRELSRIAALIFNSPGGAFSAEVRARTLGILTRKAFSVDPAWWSINNRLKQLPQNSAVAHEKVLLFLQTLAVMEGRDEGPSPSLEELASLMAAANDVIGESAQEETIGDDLADFMADLACSLRFNQSIEPMNDIVRAAAIFSTPPDQHPLGEASTWQALHSKALGADFRDYLVRFVGPLFVIAQTWGKEGSEGKGLRCPDVPRSSFLGIGIDESELRHLCVTRAQLRRTIQTRPDGLPNIPAALFDKPFVCTTDSSLTAASPRLVTDQLLWPTWRRFQSVSGDWSKAFGRPFEGWCKKIAREAAKSTAFRGGLHVWPRGSHNEIEDTIVVEPDGTLFVSVKVLRILDNDVARGLAARSRVVDAYEKMLFAKKSKGIKMGALRQLSHSIDRALYNPSGSAIIRLPIFPVLVTLGDLAENAVFYMWTDKRCKEEALLTQNGVMPLVVAQVREYEKLLELMATGMSGCKILASVRRSEDQRLGVAIADVFEKRTVSRLPLIKLRFDEIMGEIMKHLQTSLQLTHGGK